MKGFFGEYGGAFAAETLMSNLIEVEKEFEQILNEEEFNEELKELLCKYVGRPTPLTPVKQLSKNGNGASIYLKREDLTHTGAHKINNAIGQALLAKRMGKKRIIAETGAGQHGVAVATVCSFLGLECVIYMGAYDAQRQAPNVKKIQLLGAEVRLVHSGAKTLKDAINEAIRDWITNVKNTHYILGSVVGPHPFPTIVRHFQSIIGNETKEQILEEIGRLPDYVVACVGGGSNAIGIFSAFLNDKNVKLIGVEAGGDGLSTGKHASTLTYGSVGVIQGTKTYMLQNKLGEVLETTSIAPGLDYPGVGPEHSYLKDIGRVQYTSITDEKALEAFQILSKCEGIIPALESSHAVAKAIELAQTLSTDQVIIVNLSGRGDKDMDQVISALEEKSNEVFM